MIRRLLPKLLLAAAVSVACIALAELAFRRYEAVHLIRHTTAVEAAYDLGALGYNDRIASAARPASGFRILSIGDSFTWSPVPYEASWNGVIARTLDAFKPGRDHRVVNLGVPSRAPPDYLDQYAFWGPRLEHDGVIFDLYVGNDLIDLNAPETTERGIAGDHWLTLPGRVDVEPSTQPALSYGPGTRIPRRFPLRMADYVWALFWGFRVGGLGEGPRPINAPWDVYLSSMGSTSYPYRPDPDDFEIVLDGWAATLSFLLAADRIERAGTRVLIVLSPPAIFFRPDVMDGIAWLGVPVDRLRPELPGEIVTELVRRLELDLQIVDLLPCLLHSPEPRELYHSGTDSHWDEDGNRVVGELVASYVARHWLGVELAADEVCLTPLDRSVAPSMQVSELADRIFDNRLALELPHVLRARLGGQRLETRAALERIFEDLDLVSAPSTVDGAAEAARTSDSEASSSSVSGWFGDPVRLDVRGTIVVFHRGRLVGSGRTHTYWFRPTRPRPAGPAQELEFEAQIVVSCAELEAEPESIWAYGITAAGEWMPLELPAQRVACEARG
jgi:hypothetical protein